MKYEWNKLKAQGNIQKHGIDFADAVIDLEDEDALTIEDNDADEQRFKTLGWEQLSRYSLSYMLNKMKIVSE